MAVSEGRGSGLPSCVGPLREVMQIKYGAVIPLPPAEAFDFVSDPTNWPRFVNSIESVETAEGWAAAGGKARMVNRVLRQEVVTELELLDWYRPYGFRYVGRNEGRSDMVNDRVFEAVAGGTRLTGTTASHGERRAGISGLTDGVVLLAARGILRRAMKEPPAQAAIWARSRH